MIAALYVETGGAYFGLEGVDPWDIERDARLYDMFAHALYSVRSFGGVLEHPAYSLAWREYGLPDPIRGVWTGTFCGGWVTEVSQSAYGHPARKRTWLYYVPEVQGEVGAGVNSGYCLDKVRLSRSEALHTPTAFRDVLLALAESSVAVAA